MNCCEHTDPLTFMEKEAMTKTVELVSLMHSIIGSDSEIGRQDFAEFVFHIHAIQNMILAQAASVAYPDKYRGLGESLDRPSR